MQSTKPRSILLVEDSYLQQKEYKVLLENMGYEVQTATNAQEAIEMLQSDTGKKIDLVISDLRMGRPEHNGSFLAKVILEHNIDVQLLLWSGSVSEEEQKQLKKELGNIPYPLMVRVQIKVNSLSES